MAVKKKAVASKKTQSGKKTTAKKEPVKAASKATTKPVAKKPVKAAPAPAKAAAKPATTPAPVAVAEKKKPMKAPASMAAATVAKVEAPRAKTETKKSSRSSDAPTDIAPYQMKSGEEYMNDEHVKHFRVLLHSWKRDLMEEVDRTVHHMQDEAANFPDPNDRATQESEFTMELRARDRERKLIRKIDESLAKLDAGEYGFCEQCGVEIGIRRLEARPTATLCIDCKTLAEIKEKHVSN